MTVFARLLATGLAVMILAFACIKATPETCPGWLQITEVMGFNVGILLAVVGVFGVIWTA